MSESKNTVTVLQRRCRVCMALCTILSSALICVSAAWGLAGSAQARRAEPAAVLQPASVPTSYTVVLREGEVRIYSAATPGLYTIAAQVQPQNLRQSDYAALQRGLNLVGEASLAQFLEDFGS